MAAKLQRMERELAELNAALEARARAGSGEPAAAGEKR